MNVVNDSVARYIMDNLSNESGVRQGLHVHRAQFLIMNPMYDQYIVDNLNNESGVQQGWQIHREQFK